MLLLAIEWRRCECCTSRPWPSFSRSIILKCISIYERISQNNGFSIWCASDNKSLSFSQQFCFFFHLFQVEWNTCIVSFLANCSTNSSFFYETWSRYSGSIQKTVQHEWRLLHNLVSLFKVENVSPRKKNWISPIAFNLFSSSFHQNDRNAGGCIILVTEDRENVGQGQNLKKILFFEAQIFLKIPPTIKSRWR